MNACLARLAAAAAIVLFASSAYAQEGRWTPWLGCWEMVNEHVREAREGITPRASDDARPEDQDAPAAPPQVCVARSGDNAVTLTTTVPGQDPSEQTINADGAGHPLTEADCRGTETTEWSRNGTRLFSRAEVRCSDGALRSISGLAFITPDDTWLDVRSFRLEGQPTTRVTRYRRVSPAAPRRILTTGGTALSVADIKEAGGKVSAAVLEAAIAETNPFVLVNKQTLADLADSNVAPSVIDVIVALAYPDRFVVERAGASSSRTAPPVYGAAFDPFDYYYSGYYYPAYYYSPFGYAYIGYYPPYYFGGGGGYYPGGGGIPDVDHRNGPGLAINGAGYTRIRPTNELPNNPGGTRTAVGRTTAALSGGGDSGGGGATSAPSSSGGSSGGSSSSSGSGSSASPAGFSSGGGGDSGGGRTAQPR